MLLPSRPGATTRNAPTDFFPLQATPRAPLRWSEVSLKPAEKVFLLEKGFSRGRLHECPRQESPCHGHKTIEGFLGDQTPSQPAFKDSWGSAKSLPQQASYSPPSS